MTKIRTALAIAVFGIGLAVAAGAAPAYGDGEGPELPDTWQSDGIEVDIPKPRPR